MDKDEHYRNQAAQAQRMADRATNNDDKQAWLQIAQSWMMMVRRATPTAEQRFDDATEAQDTQQKR